MPTLNLFSRPGRSVILNPFMPRVDNMDNRFLRVKAKRSLFFADEDQPLLVLLRSMFIETEAEYNVKALASDLGVEVSTIYKMFSAQTRLPAETLLAIMEFVHSQDSADTRILDFICEPCGYTPMPMSARMNLKSVREILELAQSIVKEG